MKGVQKKLGVWRLLVTLAFTGIAGLANGQVANPTPYSASTRVNYVRTWDAKAPIQNPDTLARRGVLDVLQTTQYVDGLGRPFQTVVKQLSPAQKDMISGVTIYDPFGREQYKFLTFPSNAYQAGDITNDGDLKFSPFQQDSVFSKGQFPGETYYYGQLSYEPSPINRTLNSYPAGNSWVGSSRGVGVQYFTSGGG